MKSILQPQEASVELAISSTPKAEFIVMLLAINPSKSFQLVDLGIAALDFGTQRRTKLIHLALIFHGEDFLLLGQPLVKFQLQLRFRLSSLHQLCFQLLGSGGLGL
jgi:hypothetical protein